MLQVERGPADMLEEGLIYFQNGHALFAAVERVRGQDALRVLGGWGECRFSFDPNAQAPKPNLNPANGAGLTEPARQSPQGPGAGYYNSSNQAPPQRVAPQSWYSPPSQAGTPSNMPVQPGQTNPFGSSWPDPRAGSNPENGYPSPTPTHPSGSYGAPPLTGSQPGWGSQSGMRSQPSVGSPANTGATWPQPPSGPLPTSWSGGSAPITGPIQGAPNSPDLTTTSSSGQLLSGQMGMGTEAGWRQPARAEGHLLRRPHRASSAQDLLAVVRDYQLSRAQRTLLMLADGEHNVIDMARLSSKQIEEVQALLSELEGHGLIYY
jgi:hypothetical protein